MEAAVVVETAPPMRFGKLFVFVKSAAGLKNADIAMLGGKSDPYVKLTLVGTTKKSKIIKKTVSSQRLSKPLN